MGVTVFNVAFATIALTFLGVRAGVGPLYVMLPSSLAMTLVATALLAMAMRLASGPSPRARD